MSRAGDGGGPLRRCAPVPRRFTFDLPSASPPPGSAYSPPARRLPPLPSSPSSSCSSLPSPRSPFSRRQLRHRRSLSTSAARSSAQPPRAAPQQGRRRGRSAATRPPSSSEKPLSTWAALGRRLRAWLTGEPQRKSAEVTAQRSSSRPPSTPHPHGAPKRSQGKRTAPSPDASFQVADGDESSSVAFSRFLSPCSQALLELHLPPTPSSRSPPHSHAPLPHQRRRPQPLRSHPSLCSSSSHPWQLVAVYSESQMWRVPSTSSPPSLSSFHSPSSSLQSSPSPLSSPSSPGLSFSDALPAVADASAVAECELVKDAAGSAPSSWPWRPTHRRALSLPAPPPYSAASSPPPSPRLPGPPRRVSLPPLVIPGVGAADADELATISILPAPSPPPLFPLAPDAGALHAGWEMRPSICRVDDAAAFGRSALQSPLDLAMQHPTLGPQQPHMHTSVHAWRAAHSPCFHAHTHSPSPSKHRLEHAAFHRLATQLTAR